jgi:hypothetical protein
MKLHVYIKQPEAISTVYFINHSRQQYQYWKLSDSWGNNLNITWKPERIVIKPGKYIMQPNAMSTAYFINYSPE